MLNPPIRTIYLCLISLQLFGCSQPSAPPTPAKAPIVMYIDYTADPSFLAQHQVYVSANGTMNPLPLKFECNDGEVGESNYGVMEISIDGRTIPIQVTPTAQLKVLNLRQFISTDDADSKRKLQMGTYFQLGPVGTAPLELTPAQFEERLEKMPLLKLQ